MAEPGKVSSTARNIFVDPDNEVFLSVVSCWEISVKHAKGRLPLPDSPSRLVRRHREKYGTETLELGEEAALYISRLPGLHSDPFDRMLICQSIVHGLAILTPDELIMQYSVRTLW
jgi:PIN domain nuclease of toxin-antitoxin system